MFRDTLFHNLLSKVKSNYYRNQWRKHNRKNDTHLVNPTNMNSISVGNFTYGDLNIISFDDKNRLSIGSFVSIAPETTFLIDAGHKLINISTYPFCVKALGKNDPEATSKGDIIVEDDVWIGYRSTILSGVHIGQGSVVAAGAVVTKDVPPYSIVGGIPAKVIRYRFSRDVIDVLMTIDYSKLEKDMIKQHIDDLYKPIDAMSLGEIKQAIDWMPKKNDYS